MKLLFDQNLSYKLCSRLADVFPDSRHIRLLGLAQSDDHAIWQLAKGDGLVLVTQDSDFADMAALHGSPRKVIWLRCGNQSTDTVENLLRAHVAAIGSFEADTNANCLEIL